MKNVHSDNEMNTCELGELAGCCVLDRERDRATIRLDASYHAVMAVMNSPAARSAMELTKPALVRPSLRNGVSGKNGSVFLNRDSSGCGGILHTAFPMG